VDPSLPRDDLMPPLDDAAIELGAIYRSTAVRADDPPETGVRGGGRRRALLTSRSPFTHSSPATYRQEARCFVQTQ
jgi:hypothetical protein